MSTKLSTNSKTKVLRVGVPPGFDLLSHQKRKALLEIAVRNHADLEPINVSDNLDLQENQELLRKATHELEIKKNLHHN